MRKHIDEQFTEAEFHWNLIRLYKDLAAVKGKHLTPGEKVHLRGLLCGYSPAEIADKLHKNVKGTEVDLSKTIYQYIKVLVNKSSDKVDNWRNIRMWLEQAGYRIFSSPPSQLATGANIHSRIENSFVEAQVTEINASYNRGTMVFELGLRMVVPAPKPSAGTNEEEGMGKNKKNVGTEIEHENI